MESHNFLPGVETLDIKYATYLVFPPKIRQVIDPIYYNGNDIGVTTTNINDDKHCFDYLKDYPNHPKIGIDYGASILAVTSGASLDLLSSIDISQKNNSDIYFRKGSIKPYSTKLYNINTDDLRPSFQFIPIMTGKKGIFEMIKFPETKSLSILFRPDSNKTYKKDQKKVKTIIKYFLNFNT